MLSILLTGPTSIMCADAGFLLSSARYEYLPSILYKWSIQISPLQRYNRYTSKFVQIKICLYICKKIDDVWDLKMYCQTVPFGQRFMTEKRRNKRGFCCFRYLSGCYIFSLFNTWFESGGRIGEMVLSREKAKGKPLSNHSSWLRLYAIRVEKGTYS